MRGIFFLSLLLLVGSSRAVRENTLNSHPEALSPCQSSGVQFLGEEVCRFSLGALAAEAEKLDGKPVAVWGDLMLRYDLPILMQDPTSCGMARPLVYVAVSGPWESLGADLNIRHSLELSDEFKERLEDLGSVPVSLVGRFRLGGDPALANENLGTIEVISIKRLEPWPGSPLRRPCQ